MTRRARWLPDALCVIALALAGLGFALIPLWSGGVFFFWDNARLHFPQTVALHEALRSGYVPEWSYSGAGGYPIIGEGNAGIFHPARLLLTWLLPPHASFMAEIGLYFALNGVMTFAFLRQLQLGPIPALVGGIISMFSGFSIVSVKNIAHLRSLWELPLILLLAERFVSGRRRAFWILAAGLAFGLQLLTGNPHIAAVTAVASGLYVCIRTWHRCWAGDDSLRAAVFSVSSAITLWTASVVVGFAVAAVQLVPQMLHTTESTRVGGMSFDWAMGLGASLSYLAQLVLPYAYEQGYVFADPAAWGGRYFNEVSYRGLYMGMTAVSLSAVAVYRRRHLYGPGWTLLSVGLIGTALAMGKQTPLYPMLWSLPVFGSLRFPFRFLAITAFCISCLAAVGLAGLIDPARREPGRSAGPARLTREAGIPLALLLGVAGATAIYLVTLAPPWLIVARDVVQGVVVSVLLLLAAAVLVFSIAVLRGRLQWLALAGVVAFTLADLLAFRASSGYAPTPKMGDIMAPPPIAEVLARDPAQFRVMSLELWEQTLLRTDVIREFVQVHASALWGLDSLDPYESLMLRRPFIVHEALSWELLNSAQSAERLQGYLGALNVKYVIAPKETVLDGWERYFDSGNAIAWRNPSVLPRAFLVHEVIAEKIEERASWVDRARKRQGRYPDMVRNWAPLEAESQILDNILAYPLDYSKTAVVAGTNTHALKGSDPDAVVTSYPPLTDGLRFSVVTSRPGFLVISNNFYPGWTATVNDELTVIHRADWVMSGVFVPEGRSEVRLRFATPGLRPGLIVTIATLLLISLGVTRDIRRGSRPAGSRPDPAPGITAATAFEARKPGSDS